MPDAEHKVDQDGDKDESTDDDGSVRLVVVARVPHDDAVPPDAVHRPRVREHTARDDGVADAHGFRGRVARAGRVEEGEGKRGEEERDAEPGEEGALRGEPDLGVTPSVSECTRPRRALSEPLRRGDKEGSEAGRTFGSILVGSAPSFCRPSSTGACAPSVAP